MQRCGAHVAKSQRARAGVQDKIGIGDGSKIDEGDPVWKDVATSAATAIAKRVLPTPPGPVNVRSRTAGSRSNVPRAVTSRSRAISGVNGIGSRAPSLSVMEADCPSGKGGSRMSDGRITDMLDLMIMGDLRNQRPQRDGETRLCQLCGGWVRKGGIGTGFKMF